MTKVNKHPIILFDGVCNLCSGAVQFIVKRDSQAYFKFASLQSEIGQLLLARNGLSTTDFQSFILIDDGKIYTKSSAALRVSSCLQGWWKHLTVLHIMPKSIRDWLYLCIANNRYRIFGKKNQCWIPTPEIQDRFL